METGHRALLVLVVTADSRGTPAERLARLRREVRERAKEHAALKRRLEKERGWIREDC